MKPLLAVFSIGFALALYVVPGTAYSDRATLGAWLIRSLKNSVPTKPTTNEDHAQESGKEQDALTKDMEKQMKRIDVLEDIFTGSSGSRHGNGSGSVNSARRSSVDETKDLDEGLSKINDDYDDEDNDENKLTKRDVEDSTHDGEDLDSPKGVGYEESTVDKANSRKRREISDKKPDDDSKEISVKNSKSKAKDSELLLKQELTDQGTGFNDKTDSDNSSKKSVVSGKGVKSEKGSKDDEDTDSDGDLMGGTGAIHGDLESEDSGDNEQVNGSHGDEERGKGSENKKSYDDDVRYSENDEDDGKSENAGDKFENESDNDHDKESEDDGYKESEDNGEKKSKTDDDKGWEDDSNDEKLNNDDNRKPESDDQAKLRDETQKSKFEDADQERQPNSDYQELNDENSSPDDNGKWSKEDDGKSEHTAANDNDGDSDKDSKSDFFNKKSEVFDVSDKKSGHKKSEVDNRELYFSSRDDGSGENQGARENSAEDQKVSCRTVCTAPMDYETCAVPRCDYKVGTIKDLCKYLCHHQKNHCEEVCD